MINIKPIIIGIVCMIAINIGCICASATEKDVSDYSITYNNEVSEDTLQSCKVSISIPYSYSDLIPKEPVQTGDDSNIFGYLLLATISGSGMIILKKKNM